MEMATGLFLGLDQEERSKDCGGPTEQDRNEGMPSLGEVPYERGKSVWLLGAGRRSVFPSDSP